MSLYKKPQSEFFEFLSMAHPFPNTTYGPFARSMLEINPRNVPSDIVRLTTGCFLVTVSISRF